MVRQLAAIKVKSLWNTLRGQTAVLVFAILGYLYLLALVSFGSVAVVIALADGHQLIRHVVLIVGALYTAGWIVLPVIFAGQENTLDPKKLAPFLAPTKRLAAALILATGLGVAGVYMLIFTIAFTVGWGIGGGILAGIGALLGALLGAFIGFAWSRVAVAWINRFQTGRRSRENAGFIAMILILVVVTPAGIWVSALAENLSVNVISQIAQVAKWTPLGAPWALPEALAAGRVLEAVILGLIGLFTAWLGWRVWAAQLPAAMSGTKTKLTPEALQAIDSGELTLPHGARRNTTHAAPRAADAAENAPSPLLVGAARWTRLGFNRPTAAIAERTRLYWLRDPRLSSQLISVVVLIFFAIAIVKFLPASEQRPEAFSGLGGLGLLALSAFLVGQVVGIHLQYDSTAFWLEVAAGTRGRDDRTGRLLGSAPIVLLLVVGGPLLYGVIVGLSAQAIFATLTVSVLLFVSAFAASSILGSQWVYAVQPPGTSPFSSKATGEFWATIIVGIAQMVVALLFAAAPLGAMLWGVVLSPVGWHQGAAFAFAWLSAAAILVGGIWLSGRILDRTQVELLTKISAWPGHRTSA